jgi:hypothetical protein
MDIKVNLFRIGRNLAEEHGAMQNGLDVCCLDIEAKVSRFDAAKFKGVFNQREHCPARGIDRLEQRDMVFVEHGRRIFEQVLAGRQDTADGIAQIVGRNLEQLDEIDFTRIPAA